MCRLVATPLNRRELIARVMIGVGKYPDMGGRVGQQGGSRAPIPKALEGADKDKTHAAQGHARVGMPG